MRTTERMIFFEVFFQNFSAASVLKTVNVSRTRCIFLLFHSNKRYIPQQQASFFPQNYNTPLVHHIPVVEVVSPSSRGSVFNTWHR